MAFLTRYLTLAILLYYIKAEVPVFTWSNNGDLNLPQVFAGHYKSQEEFEKEYLNHGASNILMFVQNEISITDILVNGGVYGSSEGSNYEQLKLMMEDYTSSYLPSVEKPVEAILKKAQQDDFNYKQLNPSVILGGQSKDELKILNTGKNLIVVDFTGNHDADQKDIDSVIGLIIRSFKQSGEHFIAFYTAKHDFEQVDDVMMMAGEHTENSRHLLATADTKPPKANGNFLIWFDSLSIIQGDGNHNISFDNVVIDKNDCAKFNTSDVPHSSNCSVHMSLGSVGAITDISLNLEVSTSGKYNQGFWYIREAVMSFDNGTKTGQKAVMTGLMIDPTPLGFSYSCNEAPDMVLKTKQNSTDSVIIKLRFRGLQLEAFARSPPDFGYYNDCVGFFTTAIWMFLISAAVLITILLFGISMVMGINTMDRYDNPKDKTITVNTAD